MDAIIQTSFPEIKFFRSFSKNVCYQIFRKDSAFTSGCNLLSYSFTRSMNNYVGSFTLSMKEDIKGKDLFIDRVKNLDVVEIIENGEPVFFGVITSISYSALANGLNKTVNISGKSIEYLFDYLNISFNVSAMAYSDTMVQTEISNLNLKWAQNSGNNPVSVETFLSQSFDTFCDVAQKFETLSNVTIIQMIKEWYGENPWKVSGGMKFKYPITNNMFNDDTVTFMTYLRYFFPNNVYEVFGIIENGVPKLKVRECPFDGQQFGWLTDKFGSRYWGIMAGDWGNLKEFPVKSENLTDYTLTKTIDEVYTAFYSFIEGSAIDPTFYENIQNIKEGSKSSGTFAYINKEKKSIYGYKPLRVNFLGFNIEKADDDQVNEDLQNNLKELNERIGKWYENLDEMYNATISIILLVKDKQAHIGDKLSFLDGEFYITGEQHTWKYGNSPKITYTCERGGNYDKFGNFSPLLNVTRHLSEIG